MSTGCRVRNLPSGMICWQIFDTTASGVLGDVAGDIDDANNGADRKQLHRVGDSERFAAMMQAYIDYPRVKYYRDAVAKECRELLKGIVNLNAAVRYIVALGKRDLLWDLLPDLIEKHVIAVEEDENAE